MENRMTEVLLSYPLHLMDCGPVHFSTFEADINGISGTHLDFTYALASGKFKTVVIEFMPDGYPSRVRVSSSESLVLFQRDLDEAQMRRVVEAKLGSKVQLWKLIKSA
jgi:hypothetical protein